MGDTSNARARREREGFFAKYIRGNGIDIGCGNDPLTPDCRRWDVLDGDAQTMSGDLGTFDWVYSSHCLEHMVDPSAAIQRWWELVRPGGHLIVVVPDEDLYELGRWPSQFNTDHKSTWTLGHGATNSPVSHNLRDELEALPGGKIEYIKLQDTGYDRALLKSLIAQVIVNDRVLAVAMDGKKKLNSEILQGKELRCLGFWPIDQTACPFYAEASIEGVVRKRD